MAQQLETLNMPEVTVEDFTNFIREQLEFGDLTPILGIGKSGIGKTESICGLAKKYGYGYRELRLITTTEIELIGLPYREDNVTKYSPKAILPTEADGERGILVLDEITSCSDTLRAASFQLLDTSRSLGEYKLPDGWLVVGLGNGPDDGGVFENIQSALISRCSSFRVEPDIKSWKKWAIENGVHPSIIAYIEFAPEMLHKRNIEEMDSVFPCPRSWAKASTAILNRERGGGQLSRDSLRMVVASTIGAKEFESFYAFYQFNKETIKIEDILNGTATTDVDLSQREVLFITAQNIVKTVYGLLEGKGYEGMDDIPKDVLKQVANAINWVIDIAENSMLDLGMGVLQDLVANSGVLMRVLTNFEFDELCPKFMSFSVKNKVISNKNSGY